MPNAWFPQAANVQRLPGTPPSPLTQHQMQQAPVQEPVGPQQQAPLQQAPPQQANRNAQMNANVDPAFDADDDEDNFNRDWLDKIYTLCRVGILLSIVWFYSTTGRFVMMLLFMVLVYLYQSGVLQLFARNRNNAGKLQKVTCCNAV